MLKTSVRSASLRIIVPVCNGAEYVEPFLRIVPDEYKAALTFVDDGSTDDTVRRLRQHDVHVLVHDHNRGKGAALTTGLEFARNRSCEFMITLDIDLQHPPELIPVMLDVYRNQPCKRSMILGDRRDRKSMPIQRQVSNFLTSLLLTVRTNQVIRDSQCGFRGIPVELFNRITPVESGFQLESEWLIKSALWGYRIRHVVIPTIYNKEPSAMRPVRDTLKFVQLWFRSFFW